MDRTIKNLLLALIISIGISVNVKSESELEPYKVVSGISGSISSIGSDTLANLVTLWAEEFKRAYPAVNVQIQAAGSSTAPPALTEGTSSLGPMSRKMKDKELESFEARYGYKPTAVPVAIDALAVFVHKDNPITSLSMQEVDSIFSSTLRCGGDAIISAWGELGLSGAWVGRDIQLFGRNSVSGTYGYFKKQALCKGDFKNKVSDLICKEKDISFKAEDGTTHSIWKIKNPKVVNEIGTYFKQINYLYIADGHHRAASASRVQKKMAQSNPKHNGNESYNYFLATIFPHDEVQIMGYNRVVKDLCGLNDEQFLSKLGENFDIQKLSTKGGPKERFSFTMFLENSWYYLTAKQQIIKEDSVLGLDASILQDHVLEPILKIDFSLF